MKRQIKANIGTIAKKRFQLVESVIVDTLAEYDALELNLDKGQIIDRECIYTFDSQEEAIAYFKVPAMWALQKGREKWGKFDGNTFYGYEISDNGKTIVWAKN